MKSKRSRSQSGKMAKRKGDNFERKLATDLEKTYGTPGAKVGDREFYRTPLSGGMKTEYPGDIIVPDWFPYMIEAKNREEIGDLSSLFSRGKSHPLVKWIKEEEVKAATINRALLVVFTRNFASTLVATKRPPTSLQTNLVDPAMQVTVGGEEFVIFLWEDFLKTSQADLAALHPQEAKVPGQ